MNIDDALSPRDIERYVHFCRSPLRGRKPILEELEWLCAMEDITHIGFYNDHTLMLGTTRIRIVHPEKRDQAFDLGEFIIFVIRQHVNPEWRVQFRFRNVTYDWQRFNDCMHPHISVSNYPEIRIVTGKLCISRGQYPLYQYIRQGKLPHAATAFLRILRTYDPNSPWHALEQWPRIGKKWRWSK